MRVQVSRGTQTIQTEKKVSRRDGTVSPKPSQPLYCSYLYINIESLVWTHSSQMSFPILINWTRPFPDIGLLDSFIILFNLETLFCTFKISKQYPDQASCPVVSDLDNHTVYRGGSRIFGKGVHMYKGVGVRFAEFILFFLNITWKWSNLVSPRPNYFIFIGYLKTGTESGGGGQANPMSPLWICH